jgi:hypothetical protein
MFNRVEKILCPVKPLSSEFSAGYSVFLHRKKFEPLHFFQKIRNSDGLYVSDIVTIKIRLAPKALF